MSGNKKQIFTVLAALFLLFAFTAKTGVELGAAFAHAVDQMPAAVSEGESSDADNTDVKKDSGKKEFYTGAPAVIDYFPVAEIQDHAYTYYPLSRPSVIILQPPRLL